MIVTSPLATRLLFAGAIICFVSIINSFLYSFKYFYNIPLLRLIYISIRNNLHFFPKSNDLYIPNCLHLFLCDNRSYTSMPYCENSVVFPNSSLLLSMNPICIIILLVLLQDKILPLFWYKLFFVSKLLQWNSICFWPSSIVVQNYLCHHLLLLKSFPSTWIPVLFQFFTVYCKADCISFYLFILIPFIFPPLPEFHTCLCWLVFLYIGSEHST